MRKRPLLDTNLFLCPLDAPFHCASAAPLAARSPGTFAKPA